MPSTAHQLRQPPTIEAVDRGQHFADDIWLSIISRVYSPFHLFFLYYTYISNYKGNISKDSVFKPFLIIRASFIYYLAYKHYTSFIAL